MKSINIKLLLLFLPFCAFSQNDSILAGSDIRHFIVHLPSGYNSLNQYPLVLNYHGINSTATQQQSYSQMNTVADINNFIVVYPQAVNNTWNLSGSSSSPDDSLFTTVLIDSLINRYSINTSRIYICGMSMGGFMCYNLTCALNSRLAAAAVVSGNMTNAVKSNCTTSHAIPIMHIHGTADSFVPYNGSFGITDVESTVDWWAQNNQCNLSPLITPLTDITTSDSCAAEKYYYAPGTADSAEVVFIKISNGGHTWPGSIPVPLLGNTCQDFNASAVIWDFFSHHELTSTSLFEVKSEPLILYPNPASRFITIYLIEKENALIINSTGKSIPVYFESNQIDISNFSEGLYFIKTTKGRSAKIIIRKP